MIVNELTESAHFLAIKVDFLLKGLERLCVNEIVRFQGTLVSIVSDRD